METFEKKEENPKKRLKTCNDCGSSSFNEEEIDVKTLIEKFFQRYVPAVATSTIKIGEPAYTIDSNPDGLTIIGYYNNNSNSTAIKLDALRMKSLRNLLWNTINTTHKIPYNYLLLMNEAKCIKIEEHKMRKVTITDKVEYNQEEIRRMEENILEFRHQAKKFDKKYIVAFLRYIMDNKYRHFSMVFTSEEIEAIFPYLKGKNWLNNDLKMETGMGGFNLFSFYKFMLTYGDYIEYREIKRKLG